MHDWLGPAAARRSRRSLLDRPGALLATGVVVAVASFHLWVTPSNPPGFLPDEASMSYNAYLLGQSLRDENGGLLPLYIKSFGDYKSPLFTYTLAAVFRVTGPHSYIARWLAAVAVMAAVLLLGLIARRRTGSDLVAVSMIVLAGLTPWLFEVGRAAYEVALQPLVICLLLVVVESAWRLRAWTAWRGVSAGLALVALAYVYAAGRLLAPLFALALLVFAGRGRWTWLLAAWGTLAVGLIPIAAYWKRYPGALTERYDQTTFIDGSMSIPSIVWRAVSNYVHDFNLWHWAVSGDPKPYVHTYGSGSLLVPVVLLALGGVAIVLLRMRQHLWWRYVLAISLLAPLPAALTEDRFYALRLVPLAVLVILLAVPALEALVRAARRHWAARLLAGVLAVAVVVQFAHFLDNYRHRGPSRLAVFHAGVPGILHAGFANSQTIFTDHDEPHALVYARWYAVEHGIRPVRVVRLPDGGIPPVGSIVFGRFQGCDFICVKFLQSDDYWIARVKGPRPS